VRRVTAQALFASTHQDEAESPYIHGHTFYVAATKVGTSVALREDLAEIAAELHLQTLEDMLVGGGQDLHSMAAWFMERLLLRHPRLTRVELWVADRPEERVGVEREIR